MNFIAQNWMLIGVALLSGGYLIMSRFRRVGALAPAQAVLMMNHEKAIVIDTRSEGQYQAGHIVGSRSLPMEKIKAKEIKGLPKNKKLPVILVCSTGSVAMRAIPTLLEEGFELVFTLQGGIAGWVKADMPLEVGASSTSAKKK